jgi:hypothetical protein
MEPDVRRAAPGRLPQRVYWFRRAFALVCLAIIIALLMWVVSLIGGPKTATPAVTRAAPATTRTPSPPDSLEATGLPAPASMTAATATNQPTDASATGAPAPAACDPGILTLSIAGPGAVKAGATQPFTVTVTNSGSDACTFTFDSRFTLKIVSGTDEIWSTADCGQWAPTGSQALAVGATATWQSTWDRHRSQATCKSVATTLKTGTYVATAAYTGASSAQLVFLLTA